MDAIDFNLTSALSPSAPASPRPDAAQAQKEQFARDFESILIGKLLDEMKNTIGQWGFEEDGAAQQIQGLFWMNLSQDLGQQGGLGIWQDIYQSLDTTTDPATASMDDLL